MKKNSNNNVSVYDRSLLWFVLPCSALLITLNVLRILKVPVTYDEALTYNDYVTDNYSAIIHYTHSTANNHILNTLLTKFSVSTFINNVFFLRLPALIAQVIFLAFSFLISIQLFQDKKWVAACFLLLNLHPFLFEFFGLCRGYGLSVSMMAGSICFLLYYINDQRIKSLSLCLLFAVLAVYSNFTLLNYVFALALVLVWFPASTSEGVLVRRSLARAITALLCMAIILFFLVYGPLQKLQSEHQLYFGGTNGFIQDTASSLVRDSLYINSNSLSAIISIIFTVAALLSGVYIFLQARKKSIDKQTIVVFLLLLLPVFATILLHYAFGTLFLISRTALFLIPLSILAFLVVLNKINKQAANTVLLLVIIIAVLNFCINLNFSEARSWRTDKYDLDIMQRMNKNDKRSKITAGVNGWATPILQYYKITLYPTRFDTIAYIQDVTADTLYDYYYIYKSDLPLMTPQYMVDTIYGDKFALMKRR